MQVACATIGPSAPSPKITECHVIVDDLARSFSRPSVSNDNFFSESLFRTLKYRPEKPFETIFDAREWANRFIHWYNKEHLHSGLRFVTPEARHTGKDIEILAKRRDVYLKAKLKHPKRWSGQIRNWNPATEVILKKFKRSQKMSDHKKKVA